MNQIPLTSGKTVNFDNEYATIGGDLYNTYSYADHSFNENVKKSGALTATSEAAKATKDMDYLKPAESVRYTDIDSAEPAIYVVGEYEDPESHYYKGIKPEAYDVHPVSYVEVLEFDVPDDRPV